MSRFSIRNPYFVIVVCAPMARTIIGGLTSSVILTICIVPAAYLLVYGKKDKARGATRLSPA